MIWQQLLEVLEREALPDSLEVLEVQFLNQNQLQRLRQPLPVSKHSSEEQRGERISSRPLLSCKLHQQLLLTLLQVFLEELLHHQRQDWELLMRVH